MSGTMPNISRMHLNGQVNGSSIRPWWIHHHYWAMITMALLLTLPVDSRAVQSFVRRFLWWSTFQVKVQSHIHLNIATSCVAGLETDPAGFGLCGVS